MNENKMIREAEMSVSTIEDTAAESAVSVPEIEPEHPVEGVGAPVGTASEIGPETEPDPGPDPETEPAPGPVPETEAEAGPASESEPEPELADEENTPAAQDEEQIPAEKPKARRRSPAKKAAADAEPAEEKPAPKARARRTAAKSSEPTEAQKLERERREENIDRMLRSQQRAERNEKNQKFFAGISALQEAMRRKRILHGSVASVEQVSVAGTGAAAQRTTTLMGVMLDERFKVYIPFEEFYRDNPIDMNKVDLNSEEGIADFGRRQRQMSERLYGCNIDFIITNVIAVSPNDYSVSGSRRQAMEILEMRNYISANDGDPYIRIGDVREADIISVGSFGLFCNVAGVDVSIPLRDVTFQYVTNLNNLYKSGDKIEVDIMDISRRKDGHVELAVNAKAAELRSAKERQDSGVLRIGTTTIGQITSIRRSMRDPNRIVINAYLPYFKMPAVVSSMNPNTLAAAPQAGDMLRLVVTGFSDSGFVRTNCRGFHNVVNLTNR